MEYTFSGVITAIHQRKKGTKTVKDPHTKIEIAVDYIDQKTFDKIVKGICSTSHFISIGIKSK